MRTINAMIVGAPKAGTTSLLHYLAQHPSLCTHSYSEFAFFLNDAAYQKGYSNAYHKFYGESLSDTDGMILAKHVMLMYSEKAVERLYEHNPEAKLIVSLRHPIERAYSAYWYARRIGWEKSSTFEEAIRVEGSRSLANWEQWRQCAHLYNSMYVEPLQRLIRVFGRDRLKVILTDDLNADPAELCQELFVWLGVEPTIALDLTRQHNISAKARSERMAQFWAWAMNPQGQLNRFVKRLVPDTWTYILRSAVLKLNEKSFVRPPMQSETYHQLKDYFAPHIIELEKLLERDLSKWRSIAREA